MESFLSSWEWLQFQQSLGRKTWRIDNEYFKANVIRHDIHFGKNYLYVPHGPEINLGNIKSGLTDLVRSFTSQLKEIGRENKSIFIKMEPLLDVVPEVFHNAKVKLKRSNKQIQPYKTTIIDLSLPEEELLSWMHHKTRYNINLASKKGLELRESEDISVFWNLLKKTAKHDKFTTHEESYYQKLLGFFNRDKAIKTKLLLVYHEGRPIAGAIILLYADTAFYLHGASDRDYRQVMAPYFLHWEIIRKLKTINYKLETKKYDFWGIDPVKWPGVTRFKLGFGGQTIERPGSFDLPLAKFWYLAYNISRKITGR